MWSFIILFPDKSRAHKGFFSLPRGVRVFASALLLIMVFNFLPTTVYPAVSDPSSQTGDTWPPADEKEEKVVARINSFFANIPKYKQPCDDMELHYEGGLAKYLKYEDRPVMQQKRREFKAQLNSVKALRKETARAAEDLLFAALTYHRIDWDASMGDIGAALKEVSIQTGSWSMSLWELQNEEKKLREIAKEYYKLFTPVFTYLSDKKRKDVLDWFHKRVLCLQKQRRDVFKKLDKQRREIYNMAIRMVTSVAGDVAEGVTGGAVSPVAANHNHADSPSIGPWSKLEHTNMSLKLTSYQWAYTWLTSETAFSVNIYKKLLEVEEKDYTNNKLHKILQRAFYTDPSLGPWDPLKFDRGRLKQFRDKSREYRLRIAQFRAKKAIIVLYNQEAAIEVAFTKKIMIFSGLYEAAKKAFINWKAQIIDWQKNPSSIVYVDLIELEGALLGILYKFFGTTFDLVTTELIKDPLTKIASNTFGINVKTSAEKNYKQYLKEEKLLLLRIKLLEHITKNENYDQAMAFVKSLREGNFSMTVRSLLEDSNFVASTNGGLTHIFEILCEDRADRTALLFRGAQHELNGNVRAAKSRFAVIRALKVENPEIEVEQKALLEVFGKPSTDKTSSNSDIILANLDTILWALPVAKELRTAHAVSQLPSAIMKLPAWVRYAVGTIQGNVMAEDEYIKKMDTMQDWVETVIQNLARLGFDLDRLRLEMPKIYKFHFALLGNSYEWAEAAQRLRTSMWETYKMYTYANNMQFGMRGRRTPEGEELLTAAQIGEEKERITTAVRTALQKSVYHTLTHNYAAAAVHTKQYEVLVNQMIAGMGKIDLSSEIAELEASAAREEIIATWEELYFVGIEMAATSAISTGLSRILVSPIGKKIAAETVDDVFLEFAKKINPWVGKFTAAGMWDTLSGGMIDVMKATAATAIHDAEKKAYSSNIFTEKELEKGIGFLWDVSTKVAKDVGHLYAEAGVDRYADRKNYERLLERAQKSRKEIDEHYKSMLAGLGKQITDDDDPEKIKSALRTLDQRLVEESKNDFLLLKRLRYRTIMGELYEAAERRRVAENRLKEVLCFVPVSMELKTRLLGRAQSATDAKLESMSRVFAAAETRTRLALKLHTIDELKQLADRSSDDIGNFSREILKPGLDINVVRKALKESTKQAKTDEERKSINDIANEIDDIRIEKVNELLKQFFRDPRYAEYASQVVAVIQGGAAKGNPEYQGIFGDIDFTVFTRPETGVKDAELKAHIVQFFKDAGYPLAESKEKESSMDTETFVQPWGKFDATQEGLVSILQDINEKRADPTRFYSEAGTKWFLNNMYYSGKVLWTGGDERPTWFNVEPGEGHGLAIDMARYMVFLTDSKYDVNSGSYKKLQPEEKRAILEGVLKKSKYFIRLIDAYQMAHTEGDRETTGNYLYNQRKETVDSGENKDRDSSYHWQIYKNAEAMIRAQERTGKKTTVFDTSDLEIIRFMAEMKLKGDNPSPWDVFKKAGMSDDAALKKAEGMMIRMEKLTPKILAYTTEQWFQSALSAQASSSVADKKKAFNNINRTVSTIRNVVGLDDVGGSSMMAAPDLSIEDGATRMARHEQAIRNKMKATRQLRKKIKVDLETIKSMFAPIEDLMGKKTKEKIKETLEARDNTIGAIIGEANVQEEKEMLGWLKRLNSIAMQLVEEM